MKDEALRLALEALEGIHPGNMTPMAEEYWNKAITAIKQALSAPVQEATAAINTLKFLGYTYHGGEQWKPPLGECPAWLNEPAPVQEPVAWQVHPFDYGIGHEGVYARTDRPEQVEMWKRKGWTVQPLYTTSQTQPAVPDAFNPKDENPAYAAGWNDCRAEMLKGMKP
jgi:hypothetical protein